jgi:GDP-D-mannose dehydratase
VRALLEQAAAGLQSFTWRRRASCRLLNTPSETLWTNAISQMNLFEGMRQFDSTARFLVIGSSEEYGLVHADELPIRETTRCARSRRTR